MITDYASLLAAVEDHLERDDLSAPFSRFVQLTETAMRRRLRTLDMEITGTLTASGETVNLPSDIISLKNVHLAGSTADGTPDLPLDAIAPGALAYSYSGMEGTPTAYAIKGSKLLLAPIPAEPVTLNIDYIAKFTPLTASATNWIIANHPDVYFYGVLAQAYARERDEAAAGYGALFAGSLDDLASSRARDKWGPGLVLPHLVTQVSGAKC